MNGIGRNQGAIEATDVHLTYNGSKVAVRGVSFRVNEGEFFGSSVEGRPSSGWC